MQNGGYQLQMPTLTRINKIIIISYVALFVLDSIFSKAMGISLGAMFGLSGAKFFSGHIYQVITFPMIGTGLMEVVFNGLLFWLIGCELEVLWGERRYLLFLTATTLGSAFVFLIFSYFLKGAWIYPMLGMGGIVNALLLAYAILYPNRTFSFMLIFPVAAKYFCALIIFMQLYMGFFSSGAAVIWGQLGAMLFAFLFMLQQTKLSQKMRVNINDFNRERKKNKFTLIQGERDDENGDDHPPKYFQ